MKVLVTGSAGFIGNAVALSLLERGDEVVGVDCLTPYYDVSLKEARLARLTPFETFIEERTDINDDAAVAALFERHGPERVVHLAAQPGVRQAAQTPRAYIDANIGGFLAILEACRHHPVEHLVYASTSSVYGGNTNLPWSEHDGADHPLNLYAASKRANELMAHAYSHVFRVPVTGLRFFTVYGPWTRPDMALYRFTEAIVHDRVIELYNEGNMRRDFTYIDDVVAGVVKVLDRVPQPDAAWSGKDPDPATSGLAPYRIYNIGNSETVPLERYIAAIEHRLGKTAKRNLVAMQAGEVTATWADTGDLAKDFDYRPNTPVEEGVAKFVDWYLDYHGISL
jgi:UDP-glucuronate 4-epimerase